MTTISTEDFYSGMRMDHKRAKILGMGAVLAAFLIGASSSIWITSPSILDTDPATYVIVVMLMSFVFLAFGMKERLELNRSLRGVAYAAAIFAAYIVLVSLARVGLSFLFLTYRIDALLFPLLLASIVTAVFGTDGLAKLRYPIIYTLFASPLLIIPVLSLNNGFALVNAKLIYGTLGALGVGVVEKGLLLTAPSSTSISISTTCVSIGFFAAIVMFLAPVAYLYEGRSLRKYAFVASGVVLLLVFNFLRMLTLSLVWVYQGLGTAIGDFHLVAGQLLFYAAIVAMILLAGRFGLTLGRTNKRRAREARGPGRKPYLPGITAAILIGMVAFVFSYGYTNSVTSPIQLSAVAAAPQPLLYSDVFASLNASGEGVTLLGSNLNGTVFALGPATANSTANSTYVVASASSEAEAGRIIGNYSSVLGSNVRLLRNGITVRSAEVMSSNETLYVSYYALPYAISGNYTYVNYEFITLADHAVPMCGAGDRGAVEAMQSGLYNLVTGSIGKEIMNCQAALVAAAQR